MSQFSTIIVIPNVVSRPFEVGIVGVTVRRTRSAQVQPARLSKVPTLAGVSRDCLLCSRCSYRKEKIGSWPDESAVPVLLRAEFRESEHTTARLTRHPSSSRRLFSNSLRKIHHVVVVNFNVVVIIAGGHRIGPARSPNHADRPGADRPPNGGGRCAGGPGRHRLGPRGRVGHAQGVGRARRGTGPRVGVDANVDPAPGPPRQQPPASAAAVLEAFIGKCRCRRSMDGDCTDGRLDELKL
jgi:hypothetical protein